MRLIGIMPVRNEDWILGLSLRVALKWCDGVVCGLHACSDGSERVASVAVTESGKSFSLVTEPSHSWNEMEHRYRLLRVAREQGATHVALIDADEVLTANLLPNIRSCVENLPNGTILDLPLYNLRNGMNYHLTGTWGNRWVAAAFRDTPAAHWTGDRFHHREPMGVGWNRIKPLRQIDGGVMHFWGASERRLRAKHVLYKITERLRFPDKPAEVIDAYYNQAMYPSAQHITDHRGRIIRTIPPQPWTFANVKPEWIAGYENLIAEHLKLDGEPWQEAESNRLYQQYGSEQFHGLDLFGVVK